MKVFLCHSSDDKAAVRTLYRDLSKDGFDAWLDEEVLLPGQDWKHEIIQAVNETHFVIVCLSRSSVTKEGYVQKEIRLALDAADEKPEGTIFLIPVRLESCDVPARLRKWQRVDLFESSGYERLIRALSSRALQLGLSAIDFSITGACRRSGTSIVSELPRATGAGISASEVKVVKGRELGDVLSFVEPRGKQIQSDAQPGILLTVSGYLEKAGVASLKSDGLISEIVYFKSTVASDGHCRQAPGRQAYIRYGPADNEITIVDCDGLAKEFEIRCEADGVMPVAEASGGKVRSADWSAAGDSIVVGLNSGLSVLSAENGKIVTHEGYSTAVKSVCWQPSDSILFARHSDSTVYVANREGRVLRELHDLARSVVAVAVSPDGSMLAAAALNGEIGVWNESGDLIARYWGIKSAHPEYPASRCLLFSPESRFLAQAAPAESDGFAIFELTSGYSCKVRKRLTNRLAWHPSIAPTLVTTSNSKLSFWSIARTKMAP